MAWQSKHIYINLPQAWVADVDVVRNVSRFRINEGVRKQCTCLTTLYNFHAPQSIAADKGLVKTA